MLTEADTCRKCVLPKLYAAGWNDDQISEQKEFNLHTIVRLPNGVFSPYTSIPTNILFFDRRSTFKWIGTFRPPYVWPHTLRKKRIKRLFLETGTY